MLSTGILLLSEVFKVFHLFGNDVIIVEAVLLVNIYVPSVKEKDHCLKIMIG